MDGVAVDEGVALLRKEEKKRVEKNMAVTREKNEDKTFTKFNEGRYETKPNK